MRFYEDIVIRNAISETPNMVAWSLSWTDVLLFENEDEEKRTDALYSDGSRYRGAHRGINKFPIIQKISKSVLQTKNSIERLLWYLSSSNKGTLNTEIGMLFASLQDDFAKFAIDEVSVQRLIDTSISVSDVSMTQPGPDAYMKSDLTQANELFKSRVFMRFKDFNVKANIEAYDLKVINKELWEEFLRVYTIIKLIK